MDNSISFLAFNVGNPSRERALRQTAWLESNPHDIYIFSEIKDNVGFSEIKRYFSQKRYCSSYHDLKKNYGVAIFSRFPMSENAQMKKFEVSSRIILVDISVGEEKIGLIGVYSPANNRKTEYRRKKQQFFNELSSLIES